MTKSSRRRRSNRWRPGACSARPESAFDPAQVIPAPLEYQHIPITLEGTPPVVPPDAAPAPQKLTAVQLQIFARSGAAGRAPVRHVGQARFRNDAVEGAARLSPARWTIVPTADAPAVPVEPEVTTYSEYQGVAQDGQSRPGAVADRARPRTRRLRDPHGRRQPEFPALGATRRRGRHHDRRLARPESPRRCRRLGHPQRQQRAAAGRAAAASGARRRGRHRSTSGRADRSPSEQHRLRAELLSVDRIRPGRFSLAVHTRARQHERAAAAVAVPRGRAPAGRRGAHDLGATRHCRCSGLRRRPGRSSSCPT